ncbi:MAG: hypothetical protein ACD_38C00170G0002 [uncultured bacterium]|uniref:Single-stranded DNA-binding protein n=1 Tax=Candidatus Daviesbacteria bacterium GW2011_GWC2_40_12 TaxID=1618431 RepID=A0A0G0QWW2_9BACT|nr:MAG: hypothetical protein ACD_38C00170G0002 [uncultured bacterium]KKQ84295.1 MAG: Single-stranded DNA-binding protein [Candidatus Daviesbacteria bacterium GW2011_GWF2_38_7]KKR15743.1 MAG: Single-stranded DNA-binding protein [Candidatus Daviesbacteria bacterium GW2011_GWA2_39_33]KKR41886.1 MAG: Single-stranded DNA-binding protein [Candidatus Daviesbacteria bacterium GW2011_GWC2_40_12]OGE21164.1 MAG: hypothetical protein A2778_02445 [Candidatus Daviesbacteria bacterium RIFCSPHIGHO2_01_FULL_40_
MASRSWNRVELIGNLTRDPELRYTPNGAAVATFGLATNRTYVSEGERKEEVDFHRLVAWNKLAELCTQLLKKGTKVFISGRLQTRSWEAADGATRQTTEIVIEDMIVLTPKGTGGPITSEDLDSIPEAAKAESAPAEEKAPKEETKAEESKEPVEKAPQEEVKDDLPF